MADLTEQAKHLASDAITSAQGYVKVSDRLRRTRMEAARRILRNRRQSMERLFILHEMSLDKSRYERHAPQHIPIFPTSSIPVLLTISSHFPLLLIRLLSLSLSFFFLLSSPFPPLFFPLTASSRPSSWGCSISHRQGP